MVGTPELARTSRRRSAKTTRKGGGDEGTEICARRAVSYDPGSAGPDPQGLDGDYDGGMEQANRAVQDHRQRLLRRNQWPCVVSDHVSPGPHPGRYGDAGIDVTNQSEHRKAGVQGQ